MPGRKIINSRHSRRIVAIALSGAMAATVAAGLTTASVAAQPNTPSTEPRAAAPEDIGGANAKFARAAIFYSPSAGVIRSKGVVKVKKVSKGTYCIKTNFNAQRVVPDLSVEWAESSGNGLLALWRWNAFDCPNDTRWIEVRTFDFSANQLTLLSDDVAFTLTVP